MRRDVYLHEYEKMSFKERLYIVRKNDWDTSFSNYKIINPLDWSVRILWGAWVKTLLLMLWPFIYWPIMAYGAHRLKTRYSKGNGKTWFHSNREVLK